MKYRVLNELITQQEELHHAVFCDQNLDHLFWKKKKKRKVTTFFCLLCDCAPKFSGYGS